jgi:hypothetical protein
LRAGWRGGQTLAGPRREQISLKSPGAAALRRFALPTVLVLAKPLLAVRDNECNGTANPDNKAG